MSASWGGWLAGWLGLPLSIGSPGFQIAGSYIYTSKNARALQREKKSIKSISISCLCVAMGDKKFQT